MALGWNEIKARALEFSKEWGGTRNEISEAQSFLNDFFNVFGISRRKVATFEKNILKLDGRTGRIDLIWTGHILIEMKSQGKDLDKAYSQAKDYFPGLKDFELPRFIMVCDFDDFRLYDIDEDKIHEFKLNDLINNVHLFDYLLGYEKKIFKEQDPVNIEAAELMGRIHDRLKEIGYTGHPLEVYLVRLLFCLFADDTTIFEKQQFQDYIVQRTNEDGSDLAAKLQELFQVLDTPKEKRFKNLDEQLEAFPYVNGKLFEETLPIACFDSKMRQSLLDCCSINWSKISPAIFGSMFQSVMNPIERRNLGAHYTSEKNILKVIKPLFLDDLQAEFQSVKGNKGKLVDFHKKLQGLKFLDPACGCGNFLVITYRELRLLELEILRELNKHGQRVFNVNTVVLLDVDQFFGIEYEEFPARIAEVAMWLMDHQMNQLISNEFGQYFVRLPLQKAAQIHHNDALETDWESIIPNTELSYIIGNPPFSGSKIMKQGQRNQVVRLFEKAKGSGNLDYVAGWYIKAAKYIQGTTIKAAFVSTNSITQGEQVSILWARMLNKYQIKIHFAHRTFKWSNEAKGKAAVYCVIIGFANFEASNKVIFEYEDIKGEPHELKAKNINPYLVDAKDIIITNRSLPICIVPKMFKGSQPTDGGNFLLTEKEKTDFILCEPNAEKYIKPLISAHEYINGEKRFCLWLIDAEPRELRHMPHVLNRIDGVKQMRLKSPKPATVKWASKPTVFTENRQPKGNYILVPSHSSENRNYIPIGFMTKDDILNNSCLSVPNATLFHFGILTSKMHMVWVKNLCGRIKSDYRYSNEIVYTNYPWPEDPSDKQKETIEKAAQKVLDARAEFPDNSLADLYDPLAMPPTLVKAHGELDKAVDLAYRPQPFTSESNRMEFLFNLYEKYIAELFQTVKTQKKKEDRLY